MLLTTVWWFHPVIWILNRTIRRVREDCCDDFLIATGVTSENDYCDTLLRIASQPSEAAVQIACGMTGRLHPLGSRLKRIMDPRVRRAVRLSILNLVVVIAAAAVLLPGLRSQFTQAQDDQSKDAESSSVTVVPAAKELDIPADLPVAKVADEDRFFGYREYAVDFEPLHVSGRCVDKDDNPISGVEVTLLLPEWSGLTYVDSEGQKQVMEPKIAAAQSDSDGRYEFNIDRFPVKRFKPNPVEQPREANFALIATKEDYAIAWRSTHTVRFQKRPEVLDPEEAGRTFFEEEPVELDLRLRPEVRIHGVVSDDIGQPLSGATVQLGLVSDTRSLPGQAPRTMTYSLLDPDDKSDASPGFVIRQFPEKYRLAKTDSNGRYVICGLPPNARAAVVVRHKPDYEVVNRRVCSAVGESTRSETYVGMDGRLDITLTWPRRLTVTLTSPNNRTPDCIVRARSDKRNAPYLQSGAMVRTADGKATLRLPPGKYKIFVEPLPGQRLVSSTHEVEVFAGQPFQTAEFKVAAGTEVLFRAEVLGTNKPVEGVGFSAQTGEDSPPQEVQSQTAFIDHPRTDSGGILRAVVPPGTTWFLPTEIPPGYVPSAERTEAFDLVPGGRRIVLVKFKPLEDQAPQPVDDRLAALHENWDRQKRLTGCGKYTYTRNNFLRGDISLAEFDRVLDFLDGKSVSQSKQILKHVFPNLKLDHQSVMLVDGRRVAVAYSWNEAPFSWRGMMISSLNIENGAEQLRYSAANRQLNIDTARSSNTRIGGLSDLLTIPQPLRFELPGLHIDEDDNNLTLLGPGLRIVADVETGFVHEHRSLRPNESGQILRQYRPVTHTNGAVTPTLNVEARFREGKLDRASVAFLHEVELVDGFPAGTFAIAAPAGTNIIDARGTDPRRVRSRERFVVTRAPVPDAVARANEAAPVRKMVARPANVQTRPAQPPPAKGLKIGDQAPDFQVAAWYDRKGKSQAPDFSGKVVIANLHKGAPQPFADEYRNLRNALKLFEGQDVLIVSVYPSDTDAEAVMKFMTDFSLPWKFAIDSPAKNNRRSAGMTFEAFEVWHPRTLVMIDPQGRINASMQHNGQARDAIRRTSRLLKLQPAP